MVSRKQAVAFFSYQRWFASDDPEAAAWSLSIGGESVPVAAYWAYSGSTAPGGISAPLLYYENGVAREQLAGRIVVFDVAGPPAARAAMFRTGNEFHTPPAVDALAGISSDQWYQGNFVTRFGKYDEILRGSGAAGAVVIFDMSPGRASGLYTFPLLSPELVGVPGLYVDRVSAHVAG